MPSVVIEALAAGVRLVASDAGGIPDRLRHGENGWLARPGDGADLAEKILTALDEPDDSPLLEAARRTADELDWPRVAARYLAVFRDVVGGKDGRTP
jgi:glycosyltransferase involved in cell wall biosynthesis